MNIEADKKAEEQKLIDSYHSKIEGAVFDKQWDKLADICSKAIKEIPNWAWAYYRRSTASGHKKDFRLVVQDCDKAIAINHNLAEAYYNRASAHFFLNMYTKAILLNYIKKDDAYFNKGLCWIKLNNRKKAFYEFVKAKELGSQKAETILKQHFADMQ